MKKTTTKTTTKTKTTKKQSTSPSAKAFGRKAKRTNELAFTKAYQDGKEGKRIKSPRQYLKEAANRVWKKD